MVVVEAARAKEGMALVTIDGTGILGGICAAERNWVGVVEKVGLLHKENAPRVGLRVTDSGVITKTICVTTTILLLLLYNDGDDIMTASIPIFFPHFFPSFSCMTPQPPVKQSALDWKKLALHFFTLLVDHAVKEEVSKKSGSAPG